MNKNNEIRLIKKEEPITHNEPQKRHDVITSKSPIIKRMREAEERTKNRRELSDDELIELEFKEEADKIRAQNPHFAKIIQETQNLQNISSQDTQEIANNEIVIKTSTIADKNFSLDYIKDDSEFIPPFINDSTNAKQSQTAIQSPYLPPHQRQPNKPTIPLERAKIVRLNTSNTTSTNQNHTDSLTPSMTRTNIPTNLNDTKNITHNQTDENLHKNLKNQAPNIQENDTKETKSQNNIATIPQQSLEKSLTESSPTTQSLESTPIESPKIAQSPKPIESLDSTLSPKEATRQDFAWQKNTNSSTQQTPLSHNNTRNEPQNDMDNATIIDRNKTTPMHLSTTTICDNIAYKDKNEATQIEKIKKATEKQDNDKPSLANPNEANLNTTNPNEANQSISHNANITLHNDTLGDTHSTLPSNGREIANEREFASEGEFVLPPTTLLNEPIYQKIDIDEAELDLKGNKLIRKLKFFKIDGDIADIYSGPVVTTFEFRPAPNIKVSRIQTLQDDLSMELKASSIRIQAPIPGKDVVGIEIPNNTSQTIYIREIFESDEFQNSQASLAIVLGKDVIGRPIVQDLAKLPHLLIAGTTGSGKSVGLNGMILSLLYKNTPKQLRFIMIDPKRVELSLYKDIPHLLTPIIAESKKAIIALSKAVDEMNERYEMMNEIGVKNIIGYNEIAEDKGLEKLPYIVIIIDEFADLMIMGGKDAEQYLISLASKARASGIHLIIATQRPTANVVTGLIKSNLPSKISYRVGSVIDSKVILDKPGAESLLGNGDMLFAHTNNIARYHAPFSHEKEIERVADFIRKQQAVQYDDFFSLEPKESGISTTISNTIPNSEEEYIQRAKEIILETQKTSISYLQRALGIGFNKAATIIESLEKEGFLSPQNSKGKREIIN